MSCIKLQTLAQLYACMTGVDHYNQQQIFDALVSEYGTQDVSTYLLPSSAQFQSNGDIYTNGEFLSMEDFLHTETYLTFVDSDIDTAVLGCTDDNADNFCEYSDTDDGSCYINGCTNVDADNYNQYATQDDGSCVISGCMDETAENYNSEATINDGSCVDTPIYGCTDEEADNYDSYANTNDGSCYKMGCIDERAINFNASATIDDGSCKFSGTGSNKDKDKSGNNKMFLYGGLALLLLVVLNKK